MHALAGGAVARVVNQLAALGAFEARLLLDALEPGLRDDDPLDEGTEEKEVVSIMSERRNGERSDERTNEPGRAP